MSQQICVRKIQRGLQRSQWFHEAVAAFVKPVIELLKAAIAAPETSPSGGLILRAVVHIRSEDSGYSDLVILSPDGNPDRIQFRASSTAWRLIAEHKVPVVVDVHQRTATLYPSGTEPILMLDPFANGSPTVAELSERNTTHMLALPLFTDYRRIGGMLSIELSLGHQDGSLRLGGYLPDMVKLSRKFTPRILKYERETPFSIESGDGVVSEPMGRVLKLLRLFAKHDMTILICGPTGTGKSRLAEQVHGWSRRRGQPLVKVDLIGIPQNLRLGELFGWKEGSFTGAIDDRIGRVAQAEGGTLFIDEIDKLPLEAQSSLLRLLDDRTYQVLGEREERRADVRFVVATNADLRVAVREGRFLEDLYWRIGGLRVHIPPLCERVVEIGGWARLMLQEINDGIDPMREVWLTDEGELALCSWEWPGNLRELRSVLEMAYIIASSLDEDLALDGPLTVDERHIQAGLGSRWSPRQNSLRTVLEEAARAFAVEAARRKHLHLATLELRHADLFRHLVLQQAILEQESQTDDPITVACQILGQDNWVRSRHHRTNVLKSREQLAAFLHILEEPGGAKL